MFTRNKPSFYLAVVAACICGFITIGLAGTDEMTIQQGQISHASPAAAAFWVIMTVIMIAIAAMIRLSTHSHPAAPIRHDHRSTYER